MMRTYSYVAIYTLQHSAVNMTAKELCVCGSHTSKKKRPPSCWGDLLNNYTLYKGKGQKINPVDDAPSDGSVPEGDSK